MSTSTGCHGVEGVGRDKQDASVAPAPAAQPPFISFADRLKANALERPDAIAVTDGGGSIAWREFDTEVDAVAAALQRDGVTPGRSVALSGLNAIRYVVAFCGVIRAGAVAVPLPTSLPALALEAMIENCGAEHLFLDASMQDVAGAFASRRGLQLIAYDDSAAGEKMSAWMAVGARPEPFTPAPGDPFTIIYSSGTTGAPKGIVQSHGMRAGQLKRMLVQGYDHGTVALVSTPLYSNTTLGGLLPTLAAAGRAILMAKFDARRFCEIAEAERVTHAQLVPVQYQRLMALPDFDRFDLTSFIQKSCTSAPFAAGLKADVLRRWPGRLLEIYGTTEGGGACLLMANEHPDKLHTVGRPASGSDIRLIDQQGREVAPGEAGEVVGRSDSMMSGYHGLNEETRKAEWHDGEGRRYLRNGDIARFDEDGFLILLDRTKDVIISGGFNIFPSDLEAALRQNPAVNEAAVVGVPSVEWGETPIAFVTLRDHSATADDVRSDVNTRLGRMQRISAVHVLDALPRSAIGKILKRELREAYLKAALGGAEA